MKKRSGKEEACNLGEREMATRKRKKKGKEKGEEKAFICLRKKKR